METNPKYWRQNRRPEHLLSRASWTPTAFRDDVRDYVLGHLGDPGAVLVVDETGDVKKGTATAGVQRQYTGTAGRVENCQVAVYLSYAAPGGHALIDRKLHLPSPGAATRPAARLRGSRRARRLRPSLALALAMISRAPDAGTPASWVTGDEVYGADPGLRAHPGKTAARLCAGRRRQSHDGHCRRTGPGKTRWPPACRRGPGSG